MDWFGHILLSTATISTISPTLSYIAASIITTNATTFSTYSITTVTNTNYNTFTRYTTISTMFHRMTNKWLIFLREYLKGTFRMASFCRII